ncbi:MAG: peptidase S9 family protein, partial [bacterium]
MTINYFAKRWGVVCLTFIVSFAALSAKAYSQSFSLPDVLSAPYPTDLVAASKVDRIAWVFNERGMRNIWTAVAPAFEARKLTNYTQDDGQTLGSLQLTADGRILVYLRGGNANRAGEYPNPTSNPAGVEQAIWAVRT